MKQIGANLKTKGFMTEPMAFQYLAITQGLDGRILAVEAVLGG